jgi:hypothetical protein
LFFDHGSNTTAFASSSLLELIKLQQR